MGVLNTQPLKEHSIYAPIFHLLSKPSEALLNLHKKYGDLVSIRFFQTKLLFVCNPEHIEEIYNQEAKGLLSRDFLYDSKKILFGDGLVNSKGETWVKQRRLMQPLFNKEAVAVWADFIVEEATKSVEELKKSSHPNVNMTTVIKTLTQSIFIRFLFGNSVNTIKKTEKIIRTLDLISKGIGPHFVSETIGQGSLKFLFLKQIWDFRKGVKQLTFFVKQQIDGKFERQGNDLISFLIQATDKNSGYAMTKNLLKDESINLFFAGQETTNNTLSWFFYLLGKHKNLHQKVTKEIENHREDQLTLDNLAKLRHTKAALNETLRLYPPSAGLATQVIGDVVIGGHIIDKGTTIILSMFATHRDETLWQSPNDFYPGHFEEKPVTGRHKYSFYPFGGGLHNCIGRHFVEMEMMIIIVVMLREFSIQSQVSVKLSPGVTLKPDRDVMVTMTPNANK